MNCCFIGHHDAPSSLTNALSSEIERLITEKNVASFYVGNHGAFDSMALSALKALKGKYPHIVFHVVLAYMPGEKAEYSPYNDLDTVLPEGIETVPRRFAISYRNKWMVSKCEYMIAYVNHSFGSASQFVELAVRQEKLVTNLAINK